MSNEKDHSGAKTMSEKDMKKTKGGLGAKLEVAAEGGSPEHSIPKVPVAGTLPKVPGA